MLSSAVNLVGTFVVKMKNDDTGEGDLCQFEVHQSDAHPFVCVMGL